MSKKIQIAYITIFSIVAALALILWQLWTSSINFSFKSFGSYGIIAVMIIIAVATVVWLIFNLAFHLVFDYKKLPDEDKKEVRSVAKDIHSVWKGEETWSDFLCKRL